MEFYIYHPKNISIAKTFKTNKPMKLTAFMTLILVGFMMACGPSTQISKSWADPSLKDGSLKPFTKILVVAALKDEGSRRIAEDKISAQIKQAAAVPSYSYLTSGDMDQEEVEAKLKKDGFDGVILMRLTDVDKSVSYMPGTAYGGWYGYRYVTPGYYSEDKTLFVETNFYSLLTKKLLCSGTTSTLNPTQFDTTIDEIINAIRTELKMQGLIKS